MVKIRRGAVAVAMLVALGAVAGCAQGGGERPAESAQAVGSGQTKPRTPDHLVFDTGAESKAPLASVADWAVNVNDPRVLSEISSAVVAGRAIAVERSYVDGNGTIATAYTVQVEKVYKGQDLPETISLALPGGSVPLGEYIASLDESGRYEMKLGQKSDEFRLNAGEDPDEMRQPDPRTLDPDTPVAENWGMNPTGESMLAELQPDFWVFYLGEVEGDTYYGAAADHSMRYLKDGLVYSLHSEAEGSPMPESELLDG